MDYKREIEDKMYSKDAFSKWMGMEIKEVSKGRSIVEMKVRPEMCNGFGIAHGGITYSLADSALAFASNTYEGVTLSIETSISHIAPVYQGDHLKAVAKEISRSAKTGVYSVVVSNTEKVVAHFKGTVYHKRPKA
jgi:acyl-CoA thioesterase